MHKLIYIVLLVIPFAEGFSQVISKSEKIILKGDRLHKVSAMKGYNVMETMDTVSQRSVYFKLPVESARGMKTAYDLYDNMIYAISVIEFSARQYSILLIKSDLGKLDTLQSADTLKMNKIKLFGTESMESYTKIDPLSTAIYEAQIKAVHIGYSLLASKNGMVELFILLGDQLTIWQLNKDQWKKTYTETCPFSGNFFAVENKSKRFLIADTGGVFEINKKIIAVPAKSAGKDALIVVDKNKDTVYSFPAGEKTKRLKNISLKSGKRIIEN